MKLITGGTGLLGSSFSKISDDVILLGTKECDLLHTDISSMITSDIDCVIHCAARVGGLKANMNANAEFFDDNLKMNMNVLNGCRTKNVKLISVLSTCAYPIEKYVIYPLTEDQLHNGPPHKSNEGYGYAKRMLEFQARSYRQQYGSNFISVIPNNLYGLNDNYSLESGHVIPALIRKIYEAKMNNETQIILWGTGTPLREFTYAHDIAEIILWLSENYDDDNPINIGNPGSTSIHDLANMISNILEYDGEIVFDHSKPDGQFQKPSSNKKFLSLGWNGNYTPLQDGLTETIKHFTDNYRSLRGI
jgi:GDP-L-fucose synthase